MSINQYRSIIFMECHNVSYSGHETAQHCPTPYTHYSTSLVLFPYITAAVCRSIVSTVSGGPVQFPLNCPYKSYYHSQQTKTTTNDAVHHVSHQIPCHAMHCRAHAHASMCTNMFRCANASLCILINKTACSRSRCEASAVCRLT